MVEADSQPTLGAADEEAPPTRADEEPGSVVALQDELIHQLDAVDVEAPPPPDAVERGSVVALQDELIHQLDAVDAPLDSSAISLSSRSVGASPDSRSSWRDIGLETPEEKAKGRGWGFVRRCTLSSSAGSSTGPATGLSSSAGSTAAGATSSSYTAGPAIGEEEEVAAGVARTWTLTGAAKGVRDATRGCAHHSHAAAVKTSATAAAVADVVAAKATGLRLEASIQVKAAKVAVKAAAAAAKNPEGLDASGPSAAPSASVGSMSMGSASIGSASVGSVSSGTTCGMAEVEEGGEEGSYDEAAGGLTRSNTMRGEMVRFSRALSQLGTAVVYAAQTPRRSRFRGSSVLTHRSATAAEGIELLKRGCVATKYSKRGKARPTKFKLSEDESTLTWEGRTAGRTLTFDVAAFLGQRRAVLLADALDLSVGLQSDVFKRHMNLATFSKPPPPRSADPAAAAAPAAADAPAAAVAPLSTTPATPASHLFLSIVLMGALPPRPDEIDDAADDAADLIGERATLDVSLDDEETFGLWVAALRELLAEGQQRPAAYPTPYAPLHASAGMALRRAAPKDASKYELLRDACLLALDLYTKTRAFLVLTVVWALAVVIFGVLFFFLLVGWHGYESQSDADDLGNIAIQILTALFTYISFFTLPWRVANAIHLMGIGSRKRSCEAGVDFYGRPTKGIWFHIPPRKRRWIVALLCGNFLCQYATQGCRFGWSSYPASQSLPGVVWINLTFVGSILCGMFSGILQGAAEGGVRKAKPGEFPPTPVDIAIQTWKEERQKLREEMWASAAPPTASRVGPLQLASEAPKQTETPTDDSLDTPRLRSPMRRESSMVSGEV